MATIYSLMMQQLKEYISIYIYPLCLGLVVLSIWFIYITMQPVPHAPEAEMTDAPATSCATAITLNIVIDSAQFLICHVSGIFDTYVATTPNLFDDTVSMSGEYQNMLYTPMEKLAILLIPIQLIFLAAAIVISNALAMDRGNRMHDALINFLLSIMVLILLPDICNLGVDLLNAINGYILAMLGGRSLSSLIINTMNINQIVQNTLIPTLADTILWIAFLIAILFITIFFIIRFVLIWVLCLTLPVLIACNTIPMVKEIRASIVMRLVQLMLVQPVFLLCMGFFIVLMKEPMDSIAKFIVGICSLITLGLIPSVIAGVAGSRLAGISSTQMQTNIDRTLSYIGGVKDRIQEVRS